MLTISGRGEMADYYEVTNGFLGRLEAPWKNLAVKKVVIGEGVTGIGWRAFDYCFLITEVTIPESVTRIGAYAFNDCWKMTEATIPGSVTVIEDGAFSGCSVLKRVTISGSVTSIERRTFEKCRSLTEITIPGSVTVIGDGAFSDCAGLTKVTIPGSVTSIGYGAFSGCPGLKSAGPIGGGYDIEFGWTERIPENAFYTCGSLESVTVPEGVESVGASAFLGCRSLRSVTIPGSVRSVGEEAFYDCGVTSAGPSGGGYDVEFGWTEGIPAGAFSGWGSLERVTIPEGMTDIGERAFYHCGGLKGAAIPGSVKSVGDRAFEGCRLMTGAVISEGVESVGAYAFSGCESLTDVTVPGSVRSVGGCAFENCGRLAGVTFSEGVESIGAYAFRGCDGLTSVTIPGSVTGIGEGALNSCFGLKDVFYGGSRARWLRSGGPEELNWGRVAIHYAVETLESYTVVYDPCGGSGEKAPEPYDAGDALTLPGADTFAPPQGMAFKAWDVGGAEYAPGAALPVNGDLTVKAVWKLGEPVTAVLSPDGRQVEFTDPAGALMTRVKVIAVRYEGEAPADCAASELRYFRTTAVFDRALSAEWRLFLLNWSTGAPLCAPADLTD